MKFSQIAAELKKLGVTAKLGTTYKIYNYTFAPDKGVVLLFAITPGGLIQSRRTMTQEHMRKFWKSLRERGFLQIDIKQKLLVKVYSRGPGEFGNQYRFPDMEGKNAKTGR